VATDRHQTIPEVTVKWPSLFSLIRPCFALTQAHDVARLNATQCYIDPVVFSQGKKGCSRVYAIPNGFSASQTTLRSLDHRTATPMASV